MVKNTSFTGKNGEERHELKINSTEGCPHPENTGNAGILNNFRILLQIFAFCYKTALISAQPSRISQSPRRHPGLYRPECDVKLSNDHLRTSLSEKIKKKAKRRPSAKQLAALALARVFECSSLLEAVKVACKGHSNTPEVVGVTATRLKRNKEAMRAVISVRNCKSSRGIWYRVYRSC